MPFVVLYDANVLWGDLQRDLLIRVAQSGLVQAKLTGIELRRRGLEPDPETPPAGQRSCST